MSNNLENSFEFIPIIKTEFNTNYDLSKTCRLCLIQTDQLLSVFDQTSNEETEILYLEMIVECSWVQIEENDKLPKTICVQCAENLTYLYNFKKICKKSESSLNDYLNHFLNSNSNNYIKKDVKTELPEYVVEDIKVEESIVTTPDNISISKTNNGYNKIKKEINNLIDLKNTDKTNKYICQFCNRSFPRSSSLTQHLSFVHNMKEYPCKFCSKICKNPSLLKRHLRTHSDSNKEAEEELHICKDCGKIFNGPYALENFRKHKKIHTGEKPYVCNQCGKSFLVLFSLRLHERIHTGEKPHSCDECGKKFACKSNLKLHARSHTGEKPNICEVCGKGFNGMNTLQRHERIHTGEKPFVCKVCNKAYSDSSQLKVHEWIHTDKKCTCDECGKIFSSPVNLRVHKRIHAGIKPYVCQICSKAFTQSWNLKYHLRTH